MPALLVLKSIRMMLPSEVASKQSGRPAKKNCFPSGAYSYGSSTAYTVHPSNQRENDSTQAYIFSTSALRSVSRSCFARGLLSDLRMESSMHDESISLYESESPSFSAWRGRLFSLSFVQKFCMMK